MAYEIPRWIPGPPDAAGEFLGGVRAGAQIAQQQAQLNQEANLAQLRLAIQQQQQQQEMQLRQQELAQQVAYQNASVAARQQELKQQQELNNIKVQEAARTYAAQRAYQQWLGDNPDKDPSEGILKFFPGTGESFTGLGTLAHNVYLERQALRPPELAYATINNRQVPYLLTRNSQGNYGIHFVPRENTGASEAAVREKRRNFEKQRDELQKVVDSVAGSFEGKSESDFEGPALMRFRQYEQAKQKLEDLTKAIDDSYDTGDLPKLPGVGVESGGGGGGGLKIISVDGQPFTPANTATVNNPPTLRPPMDFPLQGAAPPAPSAPQPFAYNPAMMPSWNQAPASLPRITPPAPLVDQWSAQRMAQQALLRGQIPGNYRNPYEGVDRSIPDYLRTNVPDNFIEMDNRTKRPSYLVPDTGD